MSILRDKESQGICPATPWKISMDHNHGGLEDHFPF